MPGVQAIRAFQVGAATATTDTDTERGQPPRQSTVPADALSDADARRARNWRRVGIALIVAVIGLAMSGVLGQKTATVSVAGNGYRLDVTYPSVARPGLDIRWKIAVTNPQGFGDRLTIGLSQTTFDLFDFNGMMPEPDSVTSTGEMLVYEWESPPGTRFVVSIDAYIEYGEHFGLPATASVLVDDRPVLTARYKVRMVP